MMRTFAMIILALMFTFSAVAAPEIPEAVRTLVPETAAVTDAEYDDGVWEYDFRDGDMRYEVIYKGNAVVALTVRNKVMKPAATNLLTAETAVMNLTGTVLYAAEGKLTPDGISDILERGNRTEAGPTVPPGGLYMTKLWYNEPVGLETDPEE